MRCEFSKPELYDLNTSLSYEQGGHKKMIRGTEITVRAYGGAVLRRRVWDDAGQGVMICSEEEYHHALMTGEEPLCSGFPKYDIVEVLNNGNQPEGMVMRRC